MSKLNVVLTLIKFSQTFDMNLQEKCLQNAPQTLINSGEVVLNAIRQYQGFLMWCRVNKCFAGFVMLGPTFDMNLLEKCLQKP